MHLSERAQLKQATELHVYDFDDTLFDSPLPPEGTDSREWWLSPESLSPPHVPAGKEGERKLPAVDAAKKSLSSGAYTVLVTGRVDVPGMRQRLLAILKALGLTMDAVVLKEGPGPTAAFKRRAVFALAGNMPNVKKVAMWDDMADNLKAVSVAVADKGLEFDSNLIKAKHQIEARLPDLVDLVQALDARIRGRVAGETGDELDEGRKPYPIGTIRDWKDGQVIKTAKGWEPYVAPEAPAKAAEPAPAPSPAPAPATAPVPEPVAAPSEPVPSPASPKATKFDKTLCAKTLRDFLADPSPAAQQAVREQFNALCSDYGMLNRDGPPGGGQFGVLEKDPVYSSLMADGLHAWDGSIAVKEKHVIGAADVLEGKGGPSFSLHAIIHETVHGHSPIRQENFKGRYRLLEEATTEMAARKIMVDRFGEKWGWGLDDGAYSEFCNALAYGTQLALKRKGVKTPDSSDQPAKWYDLLGEACVEMRRRPPPHDPDKYAYLTRFASSLPLKGADAPDVVKEVAEAVWLALKPAREAEKERVLEAKIKKTLGSDAFKQLSVPEQQSILSSLKAGLQAARQSRKAAQKKLFDYADGKVSAADALSEALNSLLQVLMEAAPMKPILSDDEGMLPRNDLPLAIEYAKVLAEQGKLTPDALRDLAMLQDDVIGAAKAMAVALHEAGISI